VNFTELSVDRGIVRDEILAYIRDNPNTFIFHVKRPGDGIDPRTWVQYVTTSGMDTISFIIEVYRRLMAGGKISTTSIPTYSSQVVAVQNSFFELYLKEIIFEEMMALVRMGVLAQARVVNPDSRNWECFMLPDSSRIMLSEYGIKFIENAQTTPYYIEEYFARLQQVAEPDDELKGYLSEGLACLRNNLARAAAILLRLAAEHILNLLTQAIIDKMPDEKRKQEHQQKIRQAGIKIEERAEVNFKVLDSNSLFLPNSPLKERLNNELRPAFHGIRILGGSAAHLSNPVDIAQVRNYYTLFADGVESVKTLV
jgi:hypothetical protein